MIIAHPRTSSSVCTCHVTPAQLQQIVLVSEMLSSVAKICRSEIKYKDQKKNKTVSTVSLV